MLGAVVIEMGSSDGESNSQGAAINIKGLKKWGLESVKRRHSKSGSGSCACCHAGRWL
jgi:hypothetical protein